MLLTTRIKLFVDEDPSIPIPNVKISLFDRDEGDEDDLLATEFTDEKGEIFFGFESYLYTDEEDKPEWRTDSLPDLYVIVYDSQGREVLSTRSQTDFDKLVREIPVPISVELINSHSLLG